MEPGTSSVQFRCDGCLQDHLLCAAHLPCPQCLGENKSCTINGGVPVKRAAIVNIITAPSITLETDTMPPRRKVGRPRGKVGRPRKTPLQPATQHSTSAAAASGVPSSSSFAIPFVQQSIEFPDPPEPSTSAEPSGETSSRNSSESPERLPWTKFKLPDPWGKNKQVVDTALRLLQRIRTFHETHPEAEGALSELRKTLQGPAYTLRKTPCRRPGVPDPVWSREPGASSTTTPAGSQGPSKLGTASSSRTPGVGVVHTPATPLTNPQRAATATRKLATWIEGSKTITEAVWILRDFGGIAEEMDGEAVPEWMMMPA